MNLWPSENKTMNTNIKYSKFRAAPQLTERMEESLRRDHFEHTVQVFPKKKKRKSSVSYQDNPAGFYHFCPGCQLLSFRELFCPLRNLLAHAVVWVLKGSLSRWW